MQEKSIKLTPSCYLLRPLGSFFCLGHQAVSHGFHAKQEHFILKTTVLKLKCFYLKGFYLKKENVFSSQILMKD